VEDTSRFRPSRVLRAEAEAKMKSIPGSQQSTPFDTQPRSLSSMISSTSTSASVPASSPSDSVSSWRRPVQSSTNGKRVVGGAETQKSKTIEGSWRARRPSPEAVPDDWEQEEDKEKDTIETGKIKASASTEEDETTTKSNETTVSDEDVAKRAKALNRKIKAAESLQTKQKEDGVSLQPEEQVKVDSLAKMMEEMKGFGLKE
jgi:hypothetical protein